MTERQKRLRRRSRGIRNTVYWIKCLQSATIENAKPKEIVLTFTVSVNPLAKVVKEQFTVTGAVRTVSSILVDKAAQTLTVTVSTNYISTSACTLHYTPEKGGVVSTVVINNIDA